MGKVSGDGRDPRYFQVFPFHNHLIYILLRSLEIVGIRGEAANSLIPLLMLRGALPQGSPTSSILANLAFANGDYEFYHFARKHRLAYGRYVDDIAISGDYDFKEFNGVFQQIISRSGFKTAATKVHFMSRSEPQKITGLIVNNKLRPTREFIKTLSDTIWDCMEVGAEIVSDEIGISIPALRGRLNGQIAHLARVDIKKARKLDGRMHAVNWRHAPVLTP